MAQSTMGHTGEFDTIIVGSGFPTVPRHPVGAPPSELTAVPGISLLPPTTGTASTAGAGTLPACYCEHEEMARERRMDALRGVFERVRSEHERAVTQLPEMHDEMQKETP